MRKWNFCAGPAVISEEVLSEVRDELLEWGDSGMSIMEMSHRSKIYDGVATEAKQDFIDILKVPDSHDVLFLQGGATHQFSMVPLNFSEPDSQADYVLSGSWSKKAISEASMLTQVQTMLHLKTKVLRMLLMKIYGIFLAIPHTFIIVQMKPSRALLFIMLQRLMLL